MPPSHSPLDELEPGPLRDELLGPEAVRREAEARAQHDAEAAQREAAERVQRLVFTGDGGEYFRIWIVNLLLTLVTLGIYSAWAKVRKTRYFWQNTALDGHRFDYHGNPLAILRGRLLALLLLAAYTWAFDISLAAGLVTLVLLCLIGPWLFLRAQEFKLRNTSYRGLRFGFDAGLKDGYLRLAPLPVIWFAAAFAGALSGSDMTILVLSLTSALLLPWMHHRLKRLQHGHARYGSLQASFSPCSERFYSAYVKGGLLAFATGTALSILFGVFASRAFRAEWVEDASWLVGFALAALMWLCLWPYFAARLQQAVWEHSSLGPIRFRTHVQAMPLFKLVLRSMALTLVTFGLYWPYAAVALARYRVQSMELRSPLPWSEVAAQVQAQPRSASGDGAADLFGLDVGL
jgi:uncharacterized membrane protein YjgN (DUF898 family)